MRVNARERKRLPEPVRPSIPLLTWAGIAFWIACAFTYATGRAAARDMLPYIAVIAAIACAAALVVGMGFRTKASAPCIICAAVCAGALIGATTAQAVHTQAETVAGYGVNGAICTLSEDPKIGDFSTSCYADARFEDGSACRVRLILPKDASLACGMSVRVDGGSLAVDEERGEYLWRKGTAITMKASRLTIVHGYGLVDMLANLRAQAIAAIDGVDAESDTISLMKALVCGWRNDLAQSELYAGFKACGLAHLVAVSGAHLVIVTGMAAALLRRIHCPRALMIVVLTGLMFAYFIFAGEPISALRACVMTVLGLFSYFSHRRPSALNAIGIAIFGLVAIDPAASISASFALSCLATLGIALFCPLIAYMLDATPLGLMRFIRDALAITFSAMIATQPLSCALFSQLPLIAPLANALLVPLFPLACGFGLVFCLICIALPAAAAVLAPIAVVPVGMLEKSVEAMAEIPYACVPAYMPTIGALGLSAAAMAALYLLWPVRPRRARIMIAGTAAAVIAFAAVLAFVSPSGDRVVMLDVGQGDAILVASKGRTLLVDTGNADGKLLSALARQGIAHLDAVLITHSDDDHCGSLDALASCVEVDAVLLADGMLDCNNDKARSLVSQAERTASGMQGLKCGDRVHIGAFTAEVVWPHAFADDGGNADSICLLVNFDADGDGMAEAELLLTGDAESEQLGKIMDEQNLEGIDIFKAGHHGSRNGMDEDQAQRLSPDIALIGVGEGNRYGHPAQEILDMLDDAGCAVYRTDLDGDVSCIMDAAGVTVRTQR